ncbi:hypothetical protein JVT61DRAFT_3405 [Boletus reticuloceps]|uniref:Uncharacterized protein n=1 Tax=Boletus reticuloceps TaxID=495285 RepID=A0A8I2YNH6_9AGAM|nr:hypothetical protein JVT61DRAFT_3405 [Boletus reticuloceps]
MRWSEEVMLLREEIRRTLAYFEWHAQWWESQAAKVPLHSTTAIAEGFHAYAQHQSALRRQLQTRYQTLWTMILPVAGTQGAGNTFIMPSSEL